MVTRYKICLVSTVTLVTLCYTLESLYLLFKPTNLEDFNRTKSIYTYLRLQFLNQMYNQMKFIS